MKGHTPIGVVTLFRAYRLLTLTISWSVAIRPQNFQAL